MPTSEQYADRGDVFHLELNDTTFSFEVKRHFNPEQELAVVRMSLKTSDARTIIQHYIEHLVETGLASRITLH